MTDERIKQLAFKCFWACEVKGAVSTNFPRIVTPAIIEEAIRTALAESAPTEVAPHPGDARMIPNDEWEKVAYVLHWVQAWLDSSGDLAEYTAMSRVEQGMKDLKRIIGGGGPQSHQELPTKEK